MKRETKDLDSSVKCDAFGPGSSALSYILPLNIQSADHESFNLGYTPKLTPLPQITQHYNPSPSHHSPGISSLRMLRGQQEP